MQKQIQMTKRKEMKENPHWSNSNIQTYFIASNESTKVKGISIIKPATESVFLHMQWSYN